MINKEGMLFIIRLFLHSSGVMFELQICGYRSFHGGSCYFLVALVYYSSLVILVLRQIVLWLIYSLSLIMSVSLYLYRYTHISNSTVLSLLQT